MPYNLLLLPLLGGFVFIRLFIYTKFATSKLVGQRLVIWAALAGVVLMIASRCITLIVIHYLPKTAGLWELVGINTPFSGTAFLSFLLGVTVWIPLNLFCNREKASQWSTENYGSRLELLFYRASEKSIQIMVTLTDGKVYVGYVIWQPSEPHTDVSFCGILPIISGYRDPVTKQVTYSTSYVEAYERLDEKGSDGKYKIDINDFEKFFKMSSVEIASIYDPDVFLMFDDAEGSELVEPDESTEANVDT
jgi:hypothetical protein